MRKSLSLVLIALIALTAVTAFAGGNGDIRRNERAIRDQWIVVFDDSVEDVRGTAYALTRVHGGDPTYIYESAIKGFSVNLPEPAIRALSRDAQVAYIEEDGEVSIDTTQSGATWGLDRIDQRNRPLNGTFVYTGTGSGVRVYVIDTGIRTTHTQFGTRAAVSYDALGGNGQDCNGHGTHVAGTIGGSTYGVAKGAMLRAVRVLNCSGSGTNSGVIAGIDWVRANHVKPAVANMSLGGGASSAVDTAVNNAINAGVTFVVAAGNSNANACNYSPARAAAAITVGSTTSTDVRSSFSNYGSCLDIFAPGSSITSAWHTSTTATNTISGTSMASPHVAGVAAQYLSRFGNQSPATVRSALVNNATTNVLTSIGTGSPNRLLFTNY
jgi:aqualysin 1